MRCYLRFAGMFFLVLAFMMLLSAPAFAFGINWKSIGGQVGWQVLAWAISAIFAVLLATVGIVFQRLNKTFYELAEFFNAMGDLTIDPHVSKEKLALVWKEGMDVVRVWQPTPEKFKPVKK